MAVSLKHAFNCALPDDPDTTVVRPSDWNDEHNISAAENALLIGTGLGIAELPAGTTGKNLIGAATPSDAIDILGISGKADPFLQNGTGAVERTIYSKLKDFVNVADFGAMGDGSANDTTAIVNAIASLPAAGGVVYFNAGVYMVDSDALSLGNGTNSVVSTKNNIALIGEGASPYLDTLGTVIKARTSGTALLTLAGSVHGLRIENIGFDCDDVCATGIRAYSVNNSVFRNFWIKNFTSYGFSGNCRTYGSGFVGWSSGNVFENFFITSSSVVDYGAGLTLGGYYTQNYDWFRNEFRVGVIQINGGSVNPTYGIDLNFCDSNNWCDVDSSTTSGLGYSVRFNGTSNAYYPQNNYFHGCSHPDGHVTSGTIGKNLFIGHTTYDAEPTPTDANLIGFTDVGDFFGSWKYSGNVAFPATQNPSADANTLDDYEEGQTTPTPTPDSGSFTTTTCTINYTKIGRAVHVNGRISIINAGTASGGITIPMPFTAGSNAAFSGREILATGFSVNADIAESGTTIKLWKYDFTTIIGTGRSVVFSGTYFV